MDNIEKSGLELASIVFDGIAGVPILGTAVGIKSAYTAIKEEIFYERLRIFLTEAQPNHELINKLKLKLEKDEDDFFKKLWILIDRLDDDRKAAIAGKMLKDVLAGNLGVDEFLEASDFVRRMYIGHLTSLTKEYLLGSNKRASDRHKRNQLVLSGLFIESEEPVKSESHLKKVELSPIALILRKYISG